VSPRDLLALVLVNLNRMRMRVALTAIGVVIGTFVIVVLVSLAAGVQGAITDLTEAFQDLTVIEVFDFGEGGTQSSSRRTSRARLDAATLREIERLPHVVVASPREQLFGGTLRLGRLEGGTQIQGIQPRAAERMGWKLSSGRPLLGHNRAVVGARLAEQVYDRRTGRALDPPPELQGKTLQLELSRTTSEGSVETRRERVRVVGVFDAESGVNETYMALEDVRAMNRWLGMSSQASQGFTQAVVKVEAREEVASVEAAIQDMGLVSFSAQTALAFLRRLFLIIQALFGGMGAIALLVAAFGIANTMTMAIYERTREIGIMKAVGATNRDVLRIFLGEAAAIGCLGGLLGVAISWPVTKVADILARNWLQSRAVAEGSSNFDVPAVVRTPLWLVVLALGFATLVGLVSGAYPALRAASMKPLRALRTE
jgi:putative ABC transport system permease protein